MEKKQDEYMESTCSSSSNIKDDPPKKQNKSLRRGRNISEGSQTEYVGRNMTIIRRKGVMTISKGYKLDGMVLMMKKKDIKR